MGRFLAAFLVVGIGACKVSSEPGPGPSPSVTVVALTASAAPVPRPLLSALPPEREARLSGADAALPDGAIRARHILVTWAGAKGSKQTRTKDEARKRIDEALAKLQAGAEFREIAETYCEDATRVRGGDLGVFGRQEMVPAFSDAAFSLAVGQISTVIETDFGFHVVQRTQ